MCDNILHKYMFDKDIEEFKNDKIIKKLNECEKLLVKI